MPARKMTAEAKASLAARCHSFRKGQSAQSARKGSSDNTEGFTMALNAHSAPYPSHHDNLLRPRMCSVAAKSRRHTESRERCIPDPDDRVVDSGRQQGPEPCRRRTYGRSEDLLSDGINRPADECGKGHIQEANHHAGFEGENSKELENPSEKIWINRSEPGGRSRREAEHGRTESPAGGNRRRYSARFGSIRMFIRDGDLANSQDVPAIGHSENECGHDNEARGKQDTL